MLQNRLIFFLFSLITISGYSQNLVKNPSIEDNDIENPDSPTSQDQLNHSQFWKKVNTPDWFSEENLKYHGPYSNFPNFNGMLSSTDLPAHTGDKYMGVAPCELAQQKLTNKIPSMNWVVISFWFSPRGRCDTELNVYITQDQADDPSLWDCNNPNFGTVGVHVEVPINGDGSDAIHIPGSWYYWESEPLLVTEEDCEWLLIKGENEPGDGTSPDYIYIDDVSVVTSGFCSHYCAGNTGNDVILTGPPNGIATAMTGNSSDNFYATFQNATEVKFQVYNINCLIYEWYSYDVNGLVDPGYSDFALVWNGNRNISGWNYCNNSYDDVQTGKMYVIKIFAKSCNGNNFTYEGHLTVDEINSPPAISYPYRTVSTVDCCPQNAYIQNRTFEYGTYFREDVDNIIMGGANVSIGPPGNVIVKSGSTVRLNAGTAVILDNQTTGSETFIVEAGADFIVDIIPCSNNLQRLGRSPHREFMENLPDPESSQSNSVQEITVFPNPTDGNFNVQLPKQDLELFSFYEITDMEGVVIKKGTITNFDFAIDLSRAASGSYILRLHQKDGSFHSESILKL